MPALDAILQQKLQVLESKRQRRVLRETLREDGVRVRRSGRELISFSCNDYLGLTHHPQVIAATQEALQKYGAGAGASRLVTGNYPFYDELEAVLAEYKGTEAACVFGSGYLANIGAIPALVGKGDLILADKLIHACAYDGARLSGADVLRFAHNNLAHCRLLLEANRADYHHCLILTETVFSMDGDRAPL
ncbi:MAG: aminotransferase class I/II-fold pyridoxal phosphate-dependent enzyme, partial [Pseudomonadota bacterium]|nr:aminotransferase class I/II-fold pyridoxal phosphate-dependent enzyme [Pseudomonadota bacterium]